MCWGGELHRVQQHHSEVPVSQGFHLEGRWLQSFWVKTIGFVSALVAGARLRRWSGSDFPPILIFPCQVASLPEEKEGLACSYRRVSSQCYKVCEGSRLQSSDLFGFHSVITHRWGENTLPRFLSAEQEGGNLASARGL